MSFTHAGDINGVSMQPSFPNAIVILVFSVSVALFIIRRGATPKQWFCALIILAPGFYFIITSYLAINKFSAENAAIARAAAAAMALITVIRTCAFKKIWPAEPRAVTTALSLAAVLAVSAFYNLGYAQFWNAGEKRPEFIHPNDLSQYFPVVKYFPELRYNGLFNAVYAALREDHPENPNIIPPEMMVRSLDTHQFVLISDIENQIRQTKAKFTPERWQAFKQDMRFFENIFGTRTYIDVMTHDNGANGSPAWMTIAYPFFAHSIASAELFKFTAILDPLLFAIGFLSLGWAFGINTMLICMVIFGANDFYMYGSDWVGATLRHDWLAYMMLGIATLKKRHWFEGGLFLGFSAMMRAFPAILILGLAIPGLWRLLEKWRKTKSLSAKNIIRSIWPLPYVLLGVAASVTALFLLSSMLFDMHSWLEWYKKIALFESVSHGNEIGLKSLIAGTEWGRETVLHQRWVVYYGLYIFALALIFWAGRGQPLHRAALLGSLLIPVIFSPSNYYMHYICLLPLLADKNAKSWHGPAIWITLLTLCWMQYWPTQIHTHDIRFSISTSFLALTWCLLIATIIDRDRCGGIDKQCIKEP